MPSTDRLAEFSSIVTTGSISAAAKSLGLPRATLSRRLSRLEKELGVRLMHRGTRSLVLTEAGEELHRRARRITADASAAWSAVRRLDDTPRGLLRVSVTGGIDPALFTDFLRDHPEVQLEVRASTQHEDLVADGIDVAVRFGEVKDPNLIVRRLQTVRSVVVGAPDYLQRRGRPEEPLDLADHDCIVGFSGAWVPSQVWPLLDGGTVPVGGRLVGNDMMLMRAAALAGHGLVLMPRRVIAAELRDGRLLPVLEDLLGARMPVSLVYVDREYTEAKVRVFVDRAVDALTRDFQESP